MESATSLLGQYLFIFKIWFLVFKVVYKRGYTYDAIDEVNGTCEERMKAVLDSILTVGKGKKVVVVDGVVIDFVVCDGKNL